MNIDGIEARALAARTTAPPEDGKVSQVTVTQSLLDAIVGKQACVRAAEPFGEIVALTGPLGNQSAEADAVFYSHAKQDVLMLVAHIRALEATFKIV